MKLVSRSHTLLLARSKRVWLRETTLKRARNGGGLELRLPRARIKNIILTAYNRLYRHYSAACIIYYRVQQCIHHICIIIHPLHYTVMQQNDNNIFFGGKTDNGICVLVIWSNYLGQHSLPQPYLQMIIYIGQCRQLSPKHPVLLHTPHSFKCLYL